MPRTIDLSGFSEEELTHLIEEATNLRTTKFESEDRDLRRQEKGLRGELGAEQSHATLVAPTPPQGRD